MRRRAFQDAGPETRPAAPCRPRPARETRLLYTVRQAEQRSVHKKKPGGKPVKDPNIADLEASVSNRLGLKVQIIHKGDKGGEMRISYKTLEQLDDLTKRLSRSS